MRIGGEWLTVVLVWSVITAVRWSVTRADLPVRNPESVLVATSSDIPEDIRLDVINNLKDVLNAASTAVWTSTGLPLSKDITVLIPESWDTNSDFWKNLSLVAQSNLSEQPSNADIHVVLSAAFNNEPVAVQYGGCEVDGLHITLPSGFVLGNEAKEIKAKQMAREWIKYKYGVFDENGFVDDSRFPQYYRIPGTDDDDIRINECTNVPVNYTFHNTSGHDCSLQVNEGSGLPEGSSTCSIVISSENNEDVTSSLMYKDIHKLPNVNKLCGDEYHPHNNRAPNKQNVFCNGESIRDVLQKHKDFQNKTQTNFYGEAAPQIQFRFVKQSKLRVMVAVDDTNQLRGLEALLENAISIMAFTIADGSEIGIMKFEDHTTNISSLRTVDSSISSRKIIVDKIALLCTKPPPANPKLAIEESIAELVPGEDARSGFVVIISSVTPANLDESLTKKLTSLCLVAITFTPDVAQGFKEFLERHQFDKTCSRVFQILKENTNAALKQLHESLNFIIIQDSSLASNILVQQAELTTESPVFFTADETYFQYDLWLFNNEVRKTVDNKYFNFTRDDESLQLTDNPLSKNSLVLFHIEETSFAKWTCRLKYNETQYLAMVIAKPKLDSYTPTVDVWATEEKADDTKDQKAIILYAKVSSGPYPILHAQLVQAEVVSPNGNVRQTINLLDNGIGDPDITRNDGIYSRYFTQLWQIGEYKVHVTVTSNNETTIGTEISSQSCCGSEIKYTKEVPASIFERTAETTFTILLQKPKDGYEPSRVQDLRVLQVPEPFTYEMQWTAPGNEKDSGTAKEYNFFLHETQEDAYYSSNLEGKQLEIINSEKKPSPYGNIETTLLRLNRSASANTNCYITLRSKNENGKESKMSNTVEILTPHFNATDGKETTPSIATAPPIPFSDKAKSVGIAVGSLVGLVLVLVLGYLGFYCYGKVRRKKDDPESAERPKSQENSTKPNGNTDGSVTANEWQLDQDPISPVNSVPANVLLYHHEQVQDAKMKHKDPPLFTLEKLNENQPKTNGMVNSKKSDNAEVSLASEPEISEGTSSQQEEEKRQVPNPTNEPQYAKALRRTTNV